MQNSEIDDQFAAFIPRLDVAPFVARTENETEWTVTTSERQIMSRAGERDRDRFRVLELFTPRRVVVPDFRISLPLVPRWPSRRTTVSPPRYHARALRLTPEQESAIRALAGTKSLHSLAADFGVSHETIRAVIRRIDQGIGVGIGIDRGAVKTMTGQ